MILKEFDLNQLNEIEADNIFDGFYTQRWGYYSINGYAAGPLTMLELGVS